MAVLKKTSPFGQRINPMTGELGELHTGQDFGVGCGTYVQAAAKGVVKSAGWQSGGGGNRIVVDHGGGLWTTYKHLSAIGVQTGEHIERGETLSQSGTTGASTGCHLHFAVMVDGTKVDPRGWLYAWPGPAGAQVTTLSPSRDRSVTLSRICGSVLFVPISGRLAPRNGLSSSATVPGPFAPLRMAGAGEPVNGFLRKSLG